MNPAPAGRADGPWVADLHAQARRDWATLSQALADPALVAAVDAAGRTLVAALDAGGTVFVLGNGGSAAIASHLATEFAGKCVRDRMPLPALALTDSSTSLTALGNDYGFDQVFARQLLALAKPGDLLVAMSTSGGSANVLAALAVARARGLGTIYLTGERGAPTLDGGAVADHVLAAPTGYTPRVQEVHLLWAHAWSEAVDHAWQPAPEQG